MPATTYTAHGDPSSNVDATINVPLIADTLAVRGVIYNDARGGYINNIPAPSSAEHTDVGIHYANYTNSSADTSVPPNSRCSTTTAWSANAINPVTYTGIRVAALCKFNDDWNALLAQSYQNMDAEGVFYETPAELRLRRCSRCRTCRCSCSTRPTTRTGSRTPRLTIDGRSARSSWSIPAAIWCATSIRCRTTPTTRAASTPTTINACRDRRRNAPVANASRRAPPGTTRRSDTHQSHELRLSTPDDWRLRGIGGVFWEDYTIYEDTNSTVQEPAAPVSAPLVPPPGATVNDPSVRNSNTAFFDDITRGYKQKAAFGSVDFDLIPQDR